MDPAVAKVAVEATTNYLVAVGVPGAFALLVMVWLIVLAYKGKLPWGNKKEEPKKEEPKPEATGNIPMTLMGGKADPLLNAYNKLSGLIKDLERKHNTELKELSKRQERELRELENKVEELKTDCQRRLGGHAQGLTEVRGDVKNLKDDQSRTENDVEKLEGEIKELKGADDHMKSKLHQIEMKVKP